LSQKNAAITRGHILVCFCDRTHFREFFWRHDQQKLVCCLRQKNEILRTIAPPARWDGDPILLVDGMPELSGIEAFGLGIGVHWSRGAIAHFPPLDPTINHLRGKRSIKIFSHFCVERFE
jgi:hypothetical protein